MKTRIFHSILEIDKEQWNGLLPRQDLISTWEHLAAVEGAGLNDCDFRYILFEEKQKLVGCACYYYISFNMDIFNTGWLSRAVTFIRQHWFPHFLRMRVIECGVPTALGRALHWTAEADYQEIMQNLVQAMQVFAREKKATVLIVRDCLIRELPWFSFLRHLAFRRVGMLANTEMSNNWTDFSGYEMDLQRHYRYMVRRYQRTLREHQVEVSILQDYAHLAPDLVRLWKGCYEHATEYQRELLNEQYFVQMNRYMSERSRLILFSIQGRPIGFYLLVSNQAALQGLYAGMDYSVSRDVFLIFNIYLAAIRMGIEQGVGIIENGITSIPEKMNFGFKPVPLFAYMRHLSPLLNPLLSRLFTLFSEPAHFSSRSAFNQAYRERLLQGVEFSVRAGGKYQICRLDNITDTGLRFLSPNKIAGKKIAFMLEYRDESAIIITAAGKVRVCQRQSEHFIYELSLPESVWARFATLLERLQKRRRDYAAG